MQQISFVHTIHKQCKGCNKCIFKCPINANEAYFEADEGKVLIKEGFCISCGECISICDHEARDYIDDTQEVLENIAKGVKISVIIAPSAEFSFSNTKKLITYLKSIGINNVYDVSFGADICTWAHIKLIKEKVISSIISQPCPVVVSYIEKYKPMLIKYLSPIQSPAVCLATYLKKYLNLKDNIMFLSPCIGKKRECKTPYTNNAIDYNITFLKFMEHMKQNNIDLNNYEETCFDNMKGSIGFTFSRPGGLCENIKYNLKEDVWIKQVEGIDNISTYLDEYIEDIKNNRPVPLIVDALNCKHGCNLGTGTTNNIRQNEIDYVTNMKKAKITASDTKKIMKLFNKKFVMADFERKYKDRSFDYKKDKNVDMEKAFLSLGKITQEDRQLNCFSCGYGNCYDFVYDLAIGHNDKNNCKHYLLNKFIKLSLYDDLTGLNNRNSYNNVVKTLQEKHSGFVGIIFVDINGLKNANDTYGHTYGDKLIISCATILKKVFNSNVYRIGGDEFVVLFDINDENLFDNKTNDMSDLFAKEKELIVSFGASKSFSTDDLFDKMEEADQIMYKSKQEYYLKINKADRRNRKPFKTLL